MGEDSESVETLHMCSTCERLWRILQLRDNLSAYDATYVALAEVLGASLVTADPSLFRAVESTLPDLDVVC